MHLDCRGEGSSNRNASRDESVETGDESVEAGDESIEAGEKHNNHVIISRNASRHVRDRYLTRKPWACRDR